MVLRQRPLALAGFAVGNPRPPTELEAEAAGPWREPPGEAAASRSPTLRGGHGFAGGLPPASCSRLIWASEGFLGREAEDKPRVQEPAGALLPQAPAGWRQPRPVAAGERCRPGAAGAGGVGVLFLLLLLL